MTRAWFLRADGDAEGAIADMAQADGLADGSSQAAAVHGAWLAPDGRSEEARAILLRLQRQSEAGYVPPTSLAAIHAGLGETALALDALAKAYDCRDTRMAYLRDYPRWNSLKADPRFHVLLRRMGLDHYLTGVSGP